MKTGMKIAAGLFVLWIGLWGGCTRQELDVVSLKPEFNEQSKEYQQYLFERAVTYVKAYRFREVGEVKERITDEGLRAMIDSVYRVYRHMAATEALYYARPEGDTLFFVIPSDMQPDRLKRTYMYIDPSLSWSGPQPVSRGILAGFSNYPALENLTAKTFADEYRELDRLPHLEELALGIGDAALFEAANPGQKAPLTLSVTADLSANHNLKKLTVTDIDIDGFTFPDHSIDQVFLKGVNVDCPAVEKLKAKHLTASPVNVESDELVFENRDIDTLVVGKSMATGQPLTRVDVSHTNLKKLEVFIALSELVLNDGLESLRFTTKKMDTPPQLPVTLRELIVAWYLPPPDLSSLTNLEILSFESDPFPSGLIWPPNIVQLTANNASGTLDLSGLERLRRIHIMQLTTPLDEIIFPPNLVESEIDDPGSSFYSRIYISRSCKLTGKPDWIDRFITYND